ncbi:MAG TPA: chemotaxis protein CheB [Syntrophales bacterium]|nr:chemotaxis protein CheB [Syntrophales bacterium]
MAQKKKEPAQKKSRNRKRTIKSNKDKVISAIPAAGKRSSMGKLPDERFSIVGIGASAGGLEAIEQFFTHMPPDTGIAFILIPHLDPSHASMMTDLVRRFTKIAVIEAGDGMQVEPGHVFVIPPNRGGAKRRYEREMGNTISCGLYPTEAWRMLLMGSSSPLRRSPG